MFTLDNQTNIIFSSINQYLYSFLRSGQREQPSHKLQSKLIQKLKLQQLSISQKCIENSESLEQRASKVPDSYYCLPANSRKIAILLGVYKVFQIKPKQLLTFIIVTVRMNQVNQNCSLCNKPNDQMLMLSCVHDPCINCAASAFAEQIHIKGRSREVYVCEICGQETLLDNTTITELTALANTVIKTPSKAKDLQKNTATSTAAKRKETQYPGNSLAPTATPSKKIVYYCKEHSEEQISYYCFTCWANICPECAIHGSHKDHEVKLIKKAIAQVKSEYLQITTKVGESQGNMSKLKEGFLRMVKETNDRHLRQKNSVTREFDILRASIAAKEKELIRQLDEINKQNITALTSYLQVINTNYEEANKIKRTIQIITKKDEVLILQDYRKIGELEQNVLALNKNTDAISGQSSSLNVQFLQQECKSISESISRMKITLKKEEVGAYTILGQRNSSGGSINS